MSVRFAGTFTACSFCLDFSVAFLPPTRAHTRPNSLLRRGRRSRPQSRTRACEIAVFVIGSDSDCESFVFLVSSVGSSKKFFDRVVTIVLFGVIFLLFKWSNYSAHTPFPIV